MFGANTKYSFILVSIFFILCYLILGYFFERSQFNLLLFLYSVTFLGFIFLIKSNQNHKTLFGLGLIFRILLLFSTPFLSQDFYRFIWDGRLIVSGINPYEFLPNNIINTIVNFSESKILHQNMGNLSASHYSNYPPINQFIFATAALFSGKSIVGSVTSPLRHPHDAHMTSSRCVMSLRVSPFIPVLYIFLTLITNSS